MDTDISPEEARVFLDGQYIGIADDFDGYPDYLYLRRGHYRLEFKLDGFETKVVELEARPGMALEIDDKLAKIPGSKKYGSYDTPEPPGGVRRFYGKRPDGSSTPEQNEPQYEENYEAVPERDGPGDAPSQNAPPPDDRPTSDQWREAPSGGAGTAPARPKTTASPTRLAIRAEPADAAVYLDDRFIGTAEEIASQPQGLRVPAGRHTVTVSRPGYRDQTVEIEVESGKTETVEIELER